MSRKAKRREGQSTRITGKELSEVEEVTVMVDVLIEELQRKGIINKKEYDRLVAMRLHEYSKANAFEELEDEL
jgi:hypothetical protein